MDTLIDCILKMDWSNRHTDFAADDKNKYYRGFDFILLKKKHEKNVGRNIMSSSLVVDLCLVFLLPQVLALGRPYIQSRGMLSYLASVSTWTLKALTGLWCIVASLLDYNVRVTDSDPR